MRCAIYVLYTDGTYVALYTCLNMLFRYSSLTFHCILSVTCSTNASSIHHTYISADVGTIQDTDSSTNITSYVYCISDLCPHSETNKGALIYSSVCFSYANPHNCCWIAYPSTSNAFTKCRTYSVTDIQCRYSGSRACCARASWGHRILIS